MIKHITVPLLALVLALSITGALFAATFAPTITRWTPSGGGASNGGSFALRSAIGQADAGVSSGGSYMLSGGFLGGDQARYQVLVPLARR